jgi:hypothetical protein
MQKNRFVKSIAFIIVLAILSGCGGNSPSQPQPNEPYGSNSGSNSAYRLFPVMIKKEPAGNGFVNYTIQMGIENTGNQTISTGVFLGDVNLRTSEGPSYHFGQPAQTNHYFSIWGTCSIPPSIRVTTSQEDGAYTFQVGETLHPTTLDFSEYGSVSLDSTDTTFPTNQPESAFIDFPQTIQDGDITLKILGPRLSNESTFTSPWQVGIDVEVDNANSAQSGYAVLGLEIYDRFGQCHSNQRFASIDDVGPLQTKRGTIWMEPDVSWDESRENVKDMLRGAKIYISYNNGVYGGVFNLTIP